MARIIYSALVTKITGSIGGTTFQSNAYGYSVKNKPNMVNPAKVKQRFSQQALIAVQSLWLVLGSAGWPDWDAYALAYPQYSKHNPSSRLSGHAVFMKRNLMAFGDLTNMVDTPDMIPTNNPTYVPTITIAGGVLSLHPAETSSTSDLQTNIYVTAPLTPLAIIRRNMFKYIQFGYGITGSINITASYLANFPILPVVGQKVGLIFRSFGLTTGAVFAEQYYEIIVS